MTSISAIIAAKKRGSSGNGRNRGNDCSGGNKYDAGGGVGLLSVDGNAVAGEFGRIVTHLGH